MAWVHLPAFLQDKPYPSLRDRVIMGDMGTQPGVFEDTDFLVAASTGMVLTVGSGDAMVRASHPTLGNRGLYHVQNDTSASETVTIPPANGSNPRLDQVVLVVKDPSYDPTLVTSVPSLQVVQGTATAGATLDNRTGAATTLPPSSLRLADVLVPAGATTIGLANVRDRRPWARGLAKRAVTTADASRSGGVIQQSALTLRCEITGEHPVEVVWSGESWSTGATGALSGGAAYMSTTDQVSPNYLNNANQQGGFQPVATSVNNRVGFSWQWVGYPPASMIGSCLVFAFIRSYEVGTPVGYTVSLGGDATRPSYLTVRELLHGVQPTFPTS